MWVILSLTDKACNLLVVSLDNNPEIKKKKKARCHLCPYTLFDKLDCCQLSKCAFDPVFRAAPGGSRKQRMRSISSGFFFPALENFSRVISDFDLLVFLDRVHVIKLPRE